MTKRTSIKALATTAALALAALTLGTVEAQAADCVETAKIAPLLSQHFGEEAAFVGVLPNDNVIEVFSNAATQSWTVAVSVPQSAVSCVVATGNGQFALNDQLQALQAL